MPSTTENEIFKSVYERDPTLATILQRAQGATVAEPLAPRQRGSVYDTLAAIAQTMGMALPGRGGLILPAGRGVAREAARRRQATALEPEAERLSTRAPSVEGAERVDLRKAEPLFVDEMVDPATRSYGTSRVSRIEAKVPGREEPLFVGRTTMLLDPKERSAYVAFLERNPDLLLSPAEFRAMQAKVMEFLRAFGVQKFEAIPASKSRARLFGRGIGERTFEAGEPP